MLTMKLKMYQETRQTDRDDTDTVSTTKDCAFYLFHSFAIQTFLIQTNSN